MAGGRAAGSLVGQFQRARAHVRQPNLNGTGSEKIATLLKSGAATLPVAIATAHPAARPMTIELTRIIGLAENWQTRIAAITKAARPMFMPLPKSGAPAPPAMSRSETTIWLSVARAG